MIVLLVCETSYEGRMVDALASRADEGRGSLRYALGSWQPSVDPGMSEWGNPAGVMSSYLHLNEIGCVEGTSGSETSQYRQEEKTIVIPRVVASEIGSG